MRQVCWYFWCDAFLIIASCIPSCGYAMFSLSSHSPSCCYKWRCNDNPCTCPCELHVIAKCISLYPCYLHTALFAAFKSPLPKLHTFTDYNIYVHPVLWGWKSHKGHAYHCILRTENLAGTGKYKLVNNEGMKEYHFVLLWLISYYSCLNKLRAVIITSKFIKCQDWLRSLSLYGYCEIIYSVLGFRW